MQVLANPHRFMTIARRVLPWLAAATGISFAAGLYLALLASPADFQQGETVRIMYVHVPAAWMAMFVYLLMAAASATAYVFRHPLADVAAKCAAPLGAAFCFLALVTGSIWGRPMWGTWWEWGDARLMSVFILFILYLGYIAIWRAVDDPHRAAALARVVALTGVVLLPVIKFSVDWWNTLHQPASVLRMGGPRIDPSMLWPLLVMALAYMCFFAVIHLLAIENEVMARKQRAARLKAMGGQ
jgi:heme exporter protein C